MTDGYFSNQSSWNGDTYSAWVNRFGTPKAAFESVNKQPEKYLSSLMPFITPIKDKKILNVMGSHGIKALAMSLLDANVTIVDFSHENARYAQELFDAGGLSCDYKVADILSYCVNTEPDKYHLAIGEMGIIHYFPDLLLFMHAIERTLLPGGIFVLRDFHPVSTKLISFRGPTAKTRKYKVDGDYFSDRIVETNASWLKHLDSPHIPSHTVHLRNWTLGEIVTSASRAGFHIKTLVEEPNLSSDAFDRGIPKSFTLVSEKPIV